MARLIDPRGHRFGAGLAASGYCLGCRLYGLRWYAPTLFARLIAVSSRDAAG